MLFENLHLIYIGYCYYFRPQYTVSFLRNVQKRELKLPKNTILNVRFGRNLQLFRSVRLSELCELGRCFISWNTFPKFLTCQDVRFFESHLKYAFLPTSHRYNVISDYVTFYCVLLCEVLFWYVLLVCGKTWHSFSSVIFCSLWSFGAKLVPDHVRLY